MVQNNLDKSSWFERTLVSLEGPLFNYVYKILISIAPSEEVVQESFLRLWAQEYPGKFENYPKAWLYRVSRNLAIDNLRARSKFSDHDDIEELIFRPCISETLLEASLIMKEIEKLPQNQIEVLTLKFNDELSYKEIADLTGLSVSHVGVLIHTAISSIKDVVLADLNNFEPERVQNEKGELK